MTTAIIVALLILLGLGIVINGLFRLRKWLKNSPQLPEPLKFDSDSDESD